MDTFAHTLKPTDGAFDWDGEGIILTLKSVCAEGPGKLLCQPGGLDEFHPIAIFNEHTRNVTMDLPFCEKVAFKASGSMIHIAGIVERADEASDDEESVTSDEDMEGAPGLILDSDEGMSDEEDSASEGSEQRVIVEEVSMSDNEDKQSPSKLKPATGPKAKTADDKNRKGGEVSTADVSSTGGSEDEAEAEAKESSSNQTSDEKAGQRDSLKVEQKAQVIKGDTSAAPLKDKIVGKSSEKSQKEKNKGNKKEKPTEVKKQQPKAEVKAKVEQKKAKQAEKAKEEKQDEVQTPAQDAVKPGLRKTLPGGTSYEILTVGKSKQIAKRGKKINVTYRGTLKNGKEFDKGNISFVVGAGEVVPGFDKGVDGMMVGEKRRLLIPAKEGYGSKKTGSIPPNSDLVFEVTLRNVN
uniref:peptidylprolyl isomerase n=1 Tax=Locusta migratoria manilensis TaxID=229990 RepID=A0A977IV07_LOCMI|nr:FK506 binding protein [Locusta migratoria manilensis]